MVKRNSLPAWYPAECHSNNKYWTVPQWIEGLAHRSQLVRAEMEGRLDAAHLEAAILGSGKGVIPPPATVLFSIDVGQPDTVLLRNFRIELESARKQAYSPFGCSICQQIARQKSKFKLLGLMDGLGTLHRLRVLDWIDVSLWSRIAGVTLEATYLGDVFWPNEDVDRRYRLVTRTRPLACQLISQSVIYSISRVGGDV